MQLAVLCLLAFSAVRILDSCWSVYIRLL